MTYKAKLKRALHFGVQSVLKIGILRSSVERAVFVDDAYMIKYTPHGTFAFFPDETIGRFLRLRGEYSHQLTADVIALSRQIMGPDLGRIWLEVGANIGTQTVYAKGTGHFDRFLCIEPDPNNFRLLETNLTLNGMGEQAQTFQLGMGSAPAELKLRRSNWNFGGATFRTDLAIGQDHVASHFQQDEVSVQVQTLDSFVQERGLALSEIGMIWIDVEGFEGEVLKGMTEILAHPTPVLFEYMAERITAQERREIAALLAEHKKILYAFEEGRPARQVARPDEMTGEGDLLVLPGA